MFNIIINIMLKFRYHFNVIYVPSYIYNSYLSLYIYYTYTQRNIKYNIYLIITYTSFLTAYNVWLYILCLYLYL